ncbi:MAG: nucleotide exchange factor GrpE [Eubacteriales bacterium]
MQKEEQHTDGINATAPGETTVEEEISQTAGEVNGEQGEVEKYQAKADEYLQLLQRVQADFDNFRRRTAQEREDLSRYCSMRLATNLLPILDNFERALKVSGEDVNQYMEGMELIYRQFKGILEKEGIKEMDTVGKEFDPNFHEAVMQAPSEEHPDNTVVEQLQKGYFLADRVIRPAMVKVAKS